MTFFCEDKYKNFAMPHRHFFVDIPPHLRYYMGMSFFRMIPEALVEEVLSGRLKHTDLTVYFTLLRKSFNGKGFLLNSSELAKETRCHPNTIRSSLKRLKNSGHISQNKSWGGHHTKLNTIVKGGSTFVKGERCQ